MDDDHRYNTANIPYNYLSGSGSGSLNEIPSAKIHIDPTEYSSHEHDFAIDIAHRHYLPCMFIDLKNNALVHQEYCKTLRAYITELHQRGIYPVMTYSKDGHSYQYVPQEYRDITKAMIAFILYLHSKGKSLAPYTLSLDNFVYQAKEDNTEVLKFWQVRFCKADDKEKTQNRDFGLIFNVLSQLFDGYKCPVDFEQLLDLMFGYTGADKHLIKNHLAIMTTAERINFSKNCFDKEKFLSKKDKSHYTKAVCGIGNKQNWTDRFATCPHFLPVYHFCQPQQSISYRDTGYYFEVNRDLLRLCRNMATHLKDQCTDLGIDFDEQYIEMMVMSVFDVELTTFHRQLHGNKILELFI